MSKTMKKDTPEKPSQSAEASGAHEAVTGELSLVIEHMKKSNGFVKETNKELISLNKSVATQNRLLWAGALIGMLLLGGLIYSLSEQRGLRTMLRDNAMASKANTEKLADVATQLMETKKAAEDTQKAVEEQPTITVKPADTSDPTSKPTLVVLPKPQPSPKGHRKGDPPPEDMPAPKGIEIPLDIPHKKK